MHTLQAVADGVARLEKHGIEKPKEIIIQDQDGNAPAAFDYSVEEVYFDPDLNADRLRKAVTEGNLSGRAKRDVGAALIHEMTHRDHWVEITKAMGNDPNAPFSQKKAAADQVFRLMGNPHPLIGPLSDPFDPDNRFSNMATNDGGSPLSGNEAREVAFEVSTYATMNPLEFVAEVRTGVADGVQYSDRVMTLYQDYLGPKLPRVKGRKVKSVNSKKTPPWKRPAASRPKAA